MPATTASASTLLSFSAAIAATVFLFFTSCSPGGGPARADVVFLNGVIYTVDNQFTVVEAVAVKDEKFIAIGINEEILALAGENTRQVDLAGRAVVPGLVDAHAHMMMYALGLDQINAMGAVSVEAVAEMVAARATQLEPGEWILGHGWDSNDWPGMAFPTRAILDEAAPENPVCLSKQDGHASWLNSAALRIAGIDRDTPDTPGGRIVHDSAGEPTGILVDTAIDLVDRHIPEATFEKKKELLTKAVQEWLAVGLVGIHDMGGGEDNAEVVKALIDENAFPFRIYYSYNNTIDNLDQLLAAGPVEYGEGRLVIRSIKAFIDGSLGSHSAALLEPFEGRPGDTGLQVMSREELAQLGERCLNSGFQLTTHACGDRGARIILDAYEDALSRVPADDHRFRMEHAQMVHPTDIPRFASLGVIPSMQPTHCTSDHPWVIELVGQERAAYLYAWRSMLDAGAYVPCGSDFPVEDINPMLGIYAAVTRQHPDGTPENGYSPEQRMTREEVLKGFTIWAAKAAFQEDWLGSIEPGKRADLVVLDRDIMKVPPLEIIGTKVLLTILDGEVVYTSDLEQTREQ